MLVTAKIWRVCAKCSGHATTAKMLCDAKQRQHQHSSSMSALTPTVSVDVQKQTALKPPALHISQVCLLHTAWSVARVVEDCQVWQFLLDLFVHLVSKFFCATEGNTVLARLQALDELFFELLFVNKPVGSWHHEL